MIEHRHLLTPVATPFPPLSPPSLFPFSLPFTSPLLPPPPPPPPSSFIEDRLMLIDLTQRHNHSHSPTGLERRKTASGRISVGSPDLARPPFFRPNISDVHESTSSFLRAP